MHFVFGGDGSIEFFGTTTSKSEGIFVASVVEVDSGSIEELTIDGGDGGTARGAA